MTDHGDDSQLPDIRGQVRERFVTQLKEDKFVLYFQSIVPAAQSSAEPRFREILVRYREEEQNLLPPGSFLPILEEQGLMPLLDRWVVGRVLSWARDTQAAIAPRLIPRCSVNLSIDTVRRDEAFGDYVLRGIRKMGVSPASFSFEIQAAEALAYPESLARMAPPLRSAGFSFELSGFTGEESAFELATSLGFAFVKIDGSLASTISRNPKDKAKLAAIIQRCRKLGLRTVCMQVEDAETLGHLRTIHVDYVQGFGIERPRVLEASVPDSARATPASPPSLPSSGIR